MFKVPEAYRSKDIPGRKSRPGDLFGVFQFLYKRAAFQTYIHVIASDGKDSDGSYIFPWEHVSAHVSCEVYKQVMERCPTWEEMCYIKDLFWDAEDTVMQLHPPKSMYVNKHPHVLHLWRPVSVKIPLPPQIMV